MFSYFGDFLDLWILGFLDFGGRRVWRSHVNSRVALPGRESFVMSEMERERIAVARVRGRAVNKWSNVEVRR